MLSLYNLSIKDNEGFWKDQGNRLDWIKKYSKIKKLFFGCDDMKNGGVNNGVKIFNQKFCNHKPEIYDGIKATECSNLINTFFIYFPSRWHIN